MTFFAKVLNKCLSICEDQAKWATQRVKMYSVQQYLWVVVYNNDNCRSVTFFATSP